MLQAQQKSTQPNDQSNSIEEKLKQAQALVDQYDQLSNNDQPIDARQWLESLNQHAEIFLAPPSVEILSAQDFHRASARFHYAMGSCALEVENFDLAERSIFRSLSQASKMGEDSLEKQHLRYLGENALASVHIRAKRTEMIAGPCSQLEKWTTSAACNDSEKAVAMLNIHSLKELEKKGSGDVKLLEKAHALLALSKDARSLSAYADVSYKLGIRSLAEGTLEGAIRAAARFYECYETTAITKDPSIKFRTNCSVMLCIALSRSENHADIIKIAPGILDSLQVHPGQSEAEYPYSRIVIGTVLGAALALSGEDVRAKRVLNDVGWFEESEVGQKAGVSFRSVLHEIWRWRETIEVSRHQHVLVNLLKNS